MTASVNGPVPAPVSGECFDFAFDVDVPVLGDPGPPLFGDAADDPVAVVDAPPEDAALW